MTLRLSSAQIVLAGVCCLLGAVLLYLLFAPLPEYSVAGIRNVPPARFDAPPEETFKQVDDRSVFNPYRVRVNAPAVTTTTGAANLPSDLTLVGVILDGNTRLALIKSPSSPLAVGVAVGGTIQGWQISRVDPDKIVLHGAGADQELKLSANKPGPAQPQVPGQPFQPQAQPQPQPQPQPQAPAPAQPQADQDSSDNE
jgi:hypothetical protein